MKSSVRRVIFVACVCSFFTLQAMADPVPSGQLSQDQLDSISQLFGAIAPGGAILSLIAAGAIKMTFGMAKWASRSVGSFFGR